MYFVFQPVGFFFGQKPAGLNPFPFLAVGCLFDSASHAISQLLLMLIEFNFGIRYQMDDFCLHFTSILVK